MLDLEVPKVVRVEPLGKRVAVSPIGVTLRSLGKRVFTSSSGVLEAVAWNNFR